MSCLPIHHHPRIHLLEEKLKPSQSFSRLNDKFTVSLDQSVRLYEHISKFLYYVRAWFNTIRAKCTIFFRAPEVKKKFKKNST